ncbi:3' terminal RNA ribose 2'-O-methyltransferase Hen1 [Roseovarius sp. MBR-154]|jgi:3' terminal RNA ribose 2'-O-methyltransferase Hen1
MTSALHDARLAAVVAAVAETGARTVLDLGCGSGDLILRLSPLAAISRITGLDLDLPALRILQGRLDDLPEAAQHKVQIAHASMTARHAALRGYDCACLVETIEHLPLADLNRLERALFGDMRPRHIIVTTPNAEYNPVLGVPTHRFRHPGHHFEWTRDRFGQWADGVAARNRYDVTRRDVGGVHPTFGGASQMALFTRSG